RAPLARATATIARGPKHPAMRARSAAKQSATTLTQASCSSLTMGYSDFTSYIAASGDQARVYFLLCPGSPAYKYLYYYWKNNLNATVTVNWRFYAHQPARCDDRPIDELSKPSY